jgi:hypothetical protein
MPIGDQKCEDKVIITQQDLKRKYDDFIAEAIHIAKPELEVRRADEISAPGTITTDILIQIMNSDYVIADISYPNPNVFYELGLRHACRPGSILIKEKNSAVPFDIYNLRHIEYENTPSGIKKLAEGLKSAFTYMENNPNRLDNHFLDTAKNMKYRFLKFANEEELEERKKNAAKKFFLKVIENPRLLGIVLKESDPKLVPMFKELSKSPETAEVVIDYLIESGTIKL